ncbi:CDP-diacylglycerol--serine O-phosphatidyltransferase [Pseudoalteromonas denitrificans]|uniref:CDP-diacylglycerol---serine O-phosphatidyltransferase n=1 Tax=Pseudoalteromonas denitrificans DSM 6059 TaxID=1123010 RepID=A0A1I1GIN0_9GAMM|nr:CDP-diacylglycerol--serine O-phosphatidyltransferase [Pseudoalteromonas denitrificans]SFC09030.1 CDP-diacylglycerol---serine O-phosphatidyltransferase [Pseudoalteromonas denitrificans DSM 6059]
MRNDFWKNTAAFGLKADAVNILSSARDFKAQLLDHIAKAEKRIIITALYLEDDDAGREVLTALHQASLNKPSLKVTVLVDYHRARRGRIGESKSEGNAKLYCEYNEKFSSNVKVFGVPIKAKELFGVLHLKGFVFDNTLIYSGASINDVYLQQHERYRLDRYFVLNQQGLCDSIETFLNEVMLVSQATPRLDSRPISDYGQIKLAHRQLMRTLKIAKYKQSSGNSKSVLTARLFLGFGRRKNDLNKLIKNLFDQTKEELVLYTPYFNFPTPLMRSLKKLLKHGKKVTIVVGDKTANDFYISPEKPFNTIGGLPYLYETILQKFLKSQNKYLKQGLLEVYLWKDNDNSFHLKGVCADGKRHLLSGHNLNPRAWSLDIENGILLDDPNKTLASAIEDEKIQVLKHCTQITSFDELETMKDYPAPVQKILGKIKRVKGDFILKRFI